MGWIQYVDRRPQADDVWITCDRCGGAGSERGRDNLPTDRAHLGGETPSMAWRGYRPTNLCDQCGGEGGTWLPKRRPWRNHRRWPTEADKLVNDNVTSFGQSWHDDKGRWLPAMTDEMRAGFVCEYADDLTPPLEVAL